MAIDKLKIHYYLHKFAAVSVIEVFAFAFFQQTHNEIAAIAIAIAGLAAWFLLPKYVPDDGCRVRKNYPVDMHDETTGITMYANHQTHITFEKIVQIYKDTQACVLSKDPNLMAVPGPKVKFCSFTEENLPATWASYMLFNETVYVNTDLDEYMSYHDCVSDSQSVEHEFIHHILNKNNVDYDMESKHLDPAFACGPGVDNKH